MKEIDKIKKYVTEKLEYENRIGPTYLKDFLNSNKRVDRDCVIRNRIKIETYNDILKQL